jgi:hypothetical protein
LPASLSPLLFLRSSTVVVDAPFARVDELKEVYRLLVEANLQPTKEIAAAAAAAFTAWEYGRKDKTLIEARDRTAEARDVHLKARVEARNAWQLVWDPAIQPEKPKGPGPADPPPATPDLGVCCLCVAPGGGGTSAELQFKKQGVDKGGHSHEDASRYWKCKTGACAFNGWTFC